MTPKHFKFYTDCVGWPLRDVDDGLIPMIDAARQVSYRTLRRRVGPGNVDALAVALGYRVGKRMALKLRDDYAVSFHKSWLHHRRVYYVRHSAIEYVFVPTDYEEPRHD